MGVEWVGKSFVSYWNVSLCSDFRLCLVSFVSDSPSVRPQKDPVLVNLGETADLICVVDANPITPDMFTWTFLVSAAICTKALP